MRPSFFFLAFAVCLSAVSTFAGELFPSSGDYPADVLEVGFPARAAAIAQKMQRAMAADPEWAAATFMKARPPGEPVPYDPKCGVSGEDYAYFLASRKQTTLQKVADTVVHVTRQDGRVRIAIEGAGFPVPKFIFSPDGSTFSVPTGETSEARTTIHQTDPSAPTGTWNGSGWSMKIIDPKTSSMCSFRVTLGVDPSGRALMTMRFVGRLGGNPVDYARVVRWRL